jgi:hypothetical protein
MGSTLARVVLEAQAECSGTPEAVAEYVAASVIAHIRPQIEAEVRWMTIADVLAAVAHKGYTHEQQLDAIRALAAVPSGNVVVPAEPDAKQRRAGIEAANIYGANAEEIYTAMIAARKP